MLDQDAPAPEPPNPFSEEPECTIHWDTAQLHPKFLLAMATAQASISAVGKEATAQASKTTTYKYTTADAVIEELRRCFAPQGITFLASWANWDPPGLAGRKVGENQWLDWVVRLDWGLTWSDGESVGLLTGVARTVAIGNNARPPDKSANAARTNLAGYVALGLGAINRAVVDPDEDINQRNDEGTTSRHDPRGEGSGRSVPLSTGLPEARAKAAKLLSAIDQARRAAGLPREIQDATRDRIYGKRFDVSRMRADDALTAWMYLVDLLEDYVENIDDRIASEVERHEAALDRGEVT